VKNQTLYKAGSLIIGTAISGTEYREAKDRNQACNVGAVVVNGFIPSHFTSRGWDLFLAETFEYGIHFFLKVLGKKFGTLL
jgi:hypothetical protein